MTDFDTSRLQGLALLDWLRPPPGFVTRAALGTTYSLDLIAWAAALVSLSGGAVDTDNLGLVSVLRALNQLDGRVHMVAQQGCIHRPTGTRSEILPLLDRSLHTVRMPLNECSFHPKVWLVCQHRDASGDQPATWRYVLIVGSRNLTRARDYDLGVALEGWDDGHGTQLAGLEAFVQHVCARGGIADFAREFDGLDDVRWQPPNGVTEMTFGFHGASKQAWDETALARMSQAAGTSVLSLTPFLDAEATSQLARRFAGWPERCLVAGVADLDHVSRGRARADLISLCPRAMSAASEMPPTRPDADDEPQVPAGASAPPDIIADTIADDEDEPDQDDLWQDSRGLHAKVIATWHPDGTATVLVGSANLSRRGWRGVNVEAWLQMTGQSGLADALWDWAMSAAAEYTPPETTGGGDDDDAATQRLLERYHQAISAHAFTLRERGPGQTASLRADTALMGDADAHGLRLTVARLAQRLPAVTWPVNAPDVELPGCDAAERSNLLLFSLEHGADDERTEHAWIQQVQVSPPLDHDARKSAFLGRLSPRDFFRYLRTYLAPAAANADDERAGDRRTVARSRAASASAAIGGLEVETLLRTLATNPDAAETLADMDRELTSYLQSKPEAASDMAAFQAFWRNIKEVYGI